MSYVRVELDQTTHRRAKAILALMGQTLSSYIRGEIDALVRKGHTGRDDHAGTTAKEVQTVPKGDPTQEAQTGQSGKAAMFTALPAAKAPTDQPAHKGTVARVGRRGPSPSVAELSAPARAPGDQPAQEGTLTQTGRSAQADETAAGSGGPVDEAAPRTPEEPLANTGPEGSEEGSEDAGRDREDREETLQDLLSHWPPEVS